MNLGGTIRLNRTGFFILIGVIILFTLYTFITKPNDQHNANANSKEMISLRRMLHGAIESAKRGGVVIKNFKQKLQIKSKGKTKEGVEDSVTNVDIESHCVMYNSLKQTFPNVHIVSEEEHQCQMQKNDNLQLDDDKEFENIPSGDVNVPVDELTVWIDPLDATKEYTENLLQYVTTMVCVAVKGKPIIGVIHKPFTEKTSWAWVGKAHSQDLHKPVDLGTDKPIVIISISHAGEVEEILKKTLDHVTVIQAAGAGYKALEVVAGNASAYYHTTSIKKWDICAGNAIINALDGKMTTSSNDDINYSNTGTGKVVNDKGLLATIYNHDWFIDKLNIVKTQMP